MNKAPTYFSPQAHWIWDKSDRMARNYYLRVRQVFSPAKKGMIAAHGPGTCRLSITADAYYQVWLNGKPVGHGPAKSPEGERFVDVFDISSQLGAGENVLEVLAYSLGVNTMNYCLGEAGLIFEIKGPGFLVASNGSTLVQRDTQRMKQTVRRWILPYIEAVDAGQAAEQWQKATVVTKETRLLPRPVSLPARQPLTPQRIISLDSVRLPEFSCSFRIKPYLVPADQVRRWNTYVTPAYVVTDLVSPCDQEITLVPTPGQIDWYFGGHKIAAGSGWTLWNPAKSKPVLHLKKGANRLLGIHRTNHFEEIHLAAFTPYPIEVHNPFGAGGFQVIPTDKKEFEEEGKIAEHFEARIKRGDFLHMDPSDTLPDANFQDLAVNAAICEDEAPRFETLQVESGWKFSGRADEKATRLILDLGAVYNGWLSFKAFGHAGGRFIFSFFEALQEGPPLTINWPEACNNVVSYSLADGWQDFESFLAYGVRYVAIYYVGRTSAELRDVEILTANCGNLLRGSFRSDDVTLNAIYSMCEQTVISATDDTLTDCPTYEAVNWNFDNRLGAMSDLVTGRNLSIIRNTIEQYTRDPGYPGLVRSHYPSAWENRIPVFSFHWIIFCQEFFNHTGDLEFLKRVFPQVRRGLEEGLTMINPAGLLEWPMAENPWHIIDWNLHRDDDGHPVISAEQGVFIGALEAGALLAKAASDPAMKKLARAWTTAAEKLRQAAHRHFWMAKKDIYADSIHADGQLSAVTSQASNSILAFYGVGSIAWKKRFVQRLGRNDKKLLPVTSPMGQFYVMELLDQCGDVEVIFRIIRERWTQMVRAGDGTAWEHFPEFIFGEGRFPTRSRCHPFATYILKYYIKYLLGIEFSGSLTNSVRFHPRPPKGIDECHGVVPIEEGVIRAGWKREGGKLRTSIEVPRGVKVQAT